MEVMGIKIGPQIKIMADGKDNKQIHQTNRRHSESSKEARTAHRNESNLKRVFRRYYYMLLE